MNSSRITYIAFLRGINVGGHTVKMERLRGLFCEIGLHKVRSYIQTGNIFFESEEKDRQVLRKKIEEHLQTSLGYAVAVCLRTLEEVEQFLQLDPFQKVIVTPDIRLAVTFLAEPVTDESISISYLTPDGAYEVVGKTASELFVVWHLKDGRPGNSYGLIGKKIKVETTTRFWHTLAKIFAAAKEE